MNYIGLVFYFLLFFCLSGFSQNYFPIKPSTTMFFNDQSNSIFANRIDSVNPDSTEFFFFKTVQKSLPNDCDASDPSKYQKRGASWLGQKMIADTGGICYFITFYEDTISLPTFALLHDTSLIFKNSAMKVYGIVESIDSITLLSDMDSVKTIRLLVKDSVNTVLASHPLSGKSIRLSKDHGIMETVPFYDFPNYHPERLLCGSSSPKRGFYTMTIGEVNDFEIGDEIHYYITSEAGGGSGGIKLVSKMYYSKVIIDKTFLGETITYKIFKKSKKVTNFVPNEPNIITFSQDTFIGKVKDINKPITSLVPEEDLGYYTMWISNGMRLVAHVSTPDNNYYEALPDCYKYYYLSGGSFQSTYYYKGLGAYSESGSSDGYNFSYTTHKIVYYKKGGNEWGTPYNLGIDEHQENDYQIYPNPNSGSFTIVNRSVGGRSKLHIDIYDIAGKNIYSTTANENTAIINCTNKLGKGFYFVSVSQENQATKVFKIVVE